MVSLAPDVRANSSAETTAFCEYSEKSVGAKICRNGIAPPPVSVVLHRSCCRLCEIMGVGKDSCQKLMDLRMNKKSVCSYHRLFTKPQLGKHWDQANPMPLFQPLRNASAEGV